MSARFERFRSTLFVAVLGLACRHENLLGDGVEPRAMCGGTAAGDVVSDFESGAPALLPVEGRGGSWYLATDTGGGAPGLTMEVVSDPTAPHGKEVLHVFGAASKSRRYLQAHLSASPRQSTYDLSDCSLLELRARWTGGTATPLTLTIGDVHTVPDGGICGVGDGGVCHDDFGTTLALSSRWQDVPIRFDQLHQAGFGKQYPALMSGEVYGPQIIFPVGEAIDLALDDVTLH